MIRARDCAIIGGVVRVPNHHSRALQQQPSKMLCHLSSSKAVGHPLTACLVGLSDCGFSSITIIVSI